MKLKSLVVAAVFLAATSSAVLAQQNGAPQGTPATSAAGAVPVASQVRLVDSRRFHAEVAQLKAQWDALNAKYQPEREKMKQTQDTITALENELSTQGPTLSAAARQDKLARLDELKIQYKRMGEDNEAAYQRDQKEMVVPVFERIGKFMETYAPQHGIALVFDIASAQENGVLVYVAPDADVTTDVIAEYNRLYPISAAGAKPGAPPRPTGLGPAKPAGTPVKKP